MDEKNNVTGPRTRKVLAGANFAVYTLVVIAIAALANWFVNRNDKIWDLTPNKSYSLSPQTIKLLRGLDRDVTLYVFDRKQGMREGHDLLDNYASASHRVAVRYVDPDREPGLAKQFAIRTYGTIVVAAGDRHFEAQGATEEGVSNAHSGTLGKGPRKYRPRGLRSGQEAARKRNLPGQDSAAHAENGDSR